MKVICVDNLEGGKPNKDLTIGKAYDVIPSSESRHGIICITNNRGQHTYYYQKMFKTIGRIREEKLNELGI